MINSTTIGGAVRLCALAALLLTATSPAMAWDGIKTGTVYAVQVTGGQNFGFRVLLTDAANMCGDGPNWAYLNCAANHSMRDMRMP